MASTWFRRRSRGVVRPTTTSFRLGCAQLEDRTVPAYADAIYAPGTSAAYVAQIEAAMQSVFGAFTLVDRWSTTATNGSGLRQGDATTVRWGFVRDGLNIPGSGPEPTSPSILITTLDARFGAGPGGSDFTQRPWFSIFRDAYDRLGAVSGLSFVYEANDDSAPFSGTTPGLIGTRADIRIGGHPIDGGNGVLAYNYFPDFGDMVIDTNDLAPGGFLTDASQNHLRFRNVLMHENGHGVGLEHQLPVSQQALMEPLLSLSFDGPQFDDVLGLHRHYGDRLEKNGGNDTLATASPLGTVSLGGSLTLGAAGNTTTQHTDGTATDFLSIDGTGDTDVLAFTVPAGALLTLTLQPVGPTYLSGTENGPPPAEFNAAAQNDLRIELLDAVGNVIGSSNATGLGGAETITSVSVTESGTYFARVRGSQDAVQFYQLTIGTTPTVSTVITRAPGQPELTNSAPARFVVTFGSEVTGFDADDVAFTPGTITAGLTAAVTRIGTGDAYFVDVFGMSGAGTVGIALSIGAAAAAQGGAPTQPATSPITQLVAFDGLPPGIDFSPGAIGQTASAIPVTLRFSEPVAAFTASALALTNATVRNFTRVAPDLYTFTLEPTTDGLFEVDLPAGSTTDLIGNPNPVASLTGTRDTVAPVASIARVSAPAIGSGPAEFRLTFSEPIDVTTLDATAFSFDGTTVGGALGMTFQAEEANTFLVSVWGMIGEGVIRLSLPAGAVTDLAGNPTAADAGADFDVYFDAVGPTATFTSGLPLPSNAGTVPVTLSFSEAVADFSRFMVQSVGVLVTNFAASADGRTFQFTLVRTADGPFTITIPAGGANDLVGNPSTSFTFTSAFDTAAPTATLTRVSGPVVTAGPALFRLTFSEAIDPASLTPSDLSFDGSTASGALVGTFTQETLSSFLVSVTGVSGEGIIRVSLPAGTATDTAGNPTTTAATTNQTVYYDAAAPTPVFTTDGPAFSTGSSVAVTLRFTEPISGFTADLLQVTGTAQLTGFAPAGDGQTFTFSLIRTGEGPYEVSVPPAITQDLVGNPNAGGVLVGGFDTTAPGVTVAPNAPAFADTPVVFVVTFTEPPANQAEFTPADLVFSGNARPRTVTIAPGADGTRFVVTITDMIRSGVVTLEVLPGAVSDAAGNLSLGTGPISTAFTTTAPLPQYLVGDREFGIGTGAGTTPAVQFMNPNSSPRFATELIDTGFQGGVRTATGDVNRDGVADLILGSGPGAPTLVQVIDGRTGLPLVVFQPFEFAFTGGVFVAAGDLTGDGVPDVVVTPDEGGGPRVQVYRGGDFVKVADFFGIDDPNFRGGARAAVGDMSGDGWADLMVAAGFGGGPRLAGFDGTTITSTRTHLFNDFFVFEQGLRNGVYLAVGDVNGDGFADLVAGGGPGGGPRVMALSGADLTAGRADGSTVLANFFAGNPGNRGGVRVAVKNLDGDDRADLVVGDGAGAGSRVTGYFGKTLSGQPGVAFTFDAYPGFTGGVFVG